MLAMPSTARAEPNPSLMHTGIRVTHGPTYTHTRTNPSLHTLTRTCPHTHTHARTYTHTQTTLYLKTRAQTYTPTRTHTHTPQKRPTQGPLRGYVHAPNVGLNNCVCVCVRAYPKPQRVSPCMQLLLISPDVSRKLKLNPLVTFATHLRFNGTGSRALGCTWQANG